MDEGRQKEEKEEEKNVNMNHIEQTFHLVWVMWALRNVDALATSVIVREEAQ